MVGSISIETFQRKRLHRLDQQKIFNESRLPEGKNGEKRERERVETSTRKIKPVDSLGKRKVEKRKRGRVAVAEGKRARVISDILLQLGTRKRKPRGWRGAETSSWLRSIKASPRAGNFYMNGFHYVADLLKPSSREH